ncbi:OmpA family protein [Humibacter albus]|uniref:OmpA family protein n=1 Tax=Humibacter albus TaxID=427754 RepID=UPI0003B5EC00|nr:OmpA family protein [Humibacter albus]
MRPFARGVAVALGVICGLALASPASEAPAHAATAQAPSAQGKSSSHGVPVAATFTYDPAQDSSNEVIHGAINAVVRIPGGTAVFYSLGGPGNSSALNMPSIGLSTPYRAFDAWAVGIVDTAGLKYYLPLVGSDRHCLCSRIGDIGGLNGTRTPLVGYAVLPPLPARMKTATIDFGYGNLVQDVPITDALPRPIVATKPVKLGRGWPTLPTKSAIDAADTSLSIRPMATNTANPKAATKDTPTTTSIALNSSVLFDFGKSTLTTAAQAVLKDVATKLSKAGSGTVSIVGYTDSIGDDSDNQTLSEARANAVKDALSTMVTRSGISLTASGMGEQDPVADNSTDAGRALNRRVTITFTTGGK